MTCKVFPPTIFENSNFILNSMIISSKHKLLWKMFRIRIFWSESSYSGATSLTQKLLFSSIDLHTLIMVEGASPPPSSSWYADPWLRIRTFGEGFWLLNKNFQTVHKVHILNIFKSSFSKRIPFSQSHGRQIPGTKQLRPYTLMLVFPSESAVAGL